MPDMPPDPEGNPIELVDVTDYPEVQEGWLCSDGVLNAPPKPEPPEETPEAEE